MNAHDLQQTLLKTTKILAGEQIDVFMEGFAPRVEYDATTKKPTRIFIPALPDNAPEKLVRAIHGYIDHECSHIMFSDADDICDDKKSKLWHYIHNCIDDPRVNKAMGDYFIGSGKNIKAGYKYLFDEMKPEDGSPGPYDKAYVDSFDFSSEEKMAEYQMQYSSLWFAKQMGDTLSGDKYHELELDRVFGDLEKKMDKRWLDLLPKARTASDVRNLSEYYEGFFKEEALEKMQPEKGGKGGGGKMTEAEADAAMEDFSTMEEQLAEQIRKDIEYGVVEATQGFYWTDRFDSKFNKHDILKRATKGSKEYSVSGFEDEVKSITNYLTKDLRRLLEERRRRYYIGGYKSGKLNAKTLFSVKAGNDRIFKKRNEVRDINAAVSLLVDMSGSMSGGRIMVAMQSAYAFAMVLDSVGVAYEIYGFTTESASREMQVEWEKFKKGANPDSVARIVNEFSPENVYAFKEFHENFDLVSKQAMTAAAYSGTKMIQNEDSKHVKMALERLASRPERVKSLFVFSDGQPAFHTSHPQNGRNNLKYYGHEAKDKYGVDVYSVGIQSDSVSSFYKNYKIVQKVEELPTALFEFLRKVI